MFYCCWVYRFRLSRFLCIAHFSWTEFIWVQFNSLSQIADVGLTKSFANLDISYSCPNTYSGSTLLPENKCRARHAIKIQWNSLLRSEMFSNGKVLANYSKYSGSLWIRPSIRCTAKENPSEWVILLIKLFQVNNLASRIGRKYYKL